MDTRRKLFLAVVVLLCTGLAGALSEYEALDAYNSAQTYLKANDYENAIRSIYRSKEVYLQLGISNGVSKCDDVISTINSTLTQKQMADTYYKIAGDYYLLGGNTVENYQRVVLMAGNAKDTYASIKDSDGVLKSDDLIKSSNQAIEKIKTSKLEVANGLYQTANNKYLAGSYLDARTLALNASQLYSSVPDPDGMAKTAALVSACDLKIREIKINAAAGYDKALQLYSKSCTSSTNREQAAEALNYATEAKRLYESISDSDGIQKTRSLVSNINECLGSDIEAKLRMARSRYLEAQEFYIVRDCPNATGKASDSKTIYQGLYDEAWKTEKDLWSDQRVKTKLYGAYIAEVNQLIEKIKTLCGEKVMLEQAEKFYKQAQESFLKNKLSDALSFSKNAKNLYTDLKNYVGMSKTDSLMEQINDKINQVQTAEQYMKKAKESYAIADFETAMYQATQAKSIYDRMSYDEKSKDVQTYLNKIENGSKMKNTASSQLNAARNLLENGNYASAVENAKIAKSLYAQVNYGLGVNESDKILKEAQMKQVEVENKTRNTIIAGALVVVVVGFLAYSWMRKQRKFETEVQERRVIDDQRIRKREEELTLRKDEEVKEKVEDELRRLIERERMASEEDGKNA